METYEPFSGPRKVTLSTPLDKVAALQRGGSIIPRKMRLRRSSKLMIQDPYTLFVALDKDESASGDLYIDGESHFRRARTPTCPRTRVCACQP